MREWKPWPKTSRKWLFWNTSVLYVENKPAHKNGVAAETTLIHFKDKAPRGNYNLIQPQPREISLPGVSYDLIWQQPFQMEAVKNPTVEI